MDKPMSDASFILMGLMFRVRDLVSPRSKILKEAGIEAGHRVLDYGCGTGSYILPAIEQIGSTGKLFALDIHPLAVRQVRRIADRRGFTNIETIQSDCITGLPANELDVVLLYDTFHDLTRPDDVLRELHRILKPGGTLSFSDHHMKEPEILEKITALGLFALLKKGDNTYRFTKTV